MSSQPGSARQPSPELFFETAFAYQRTAALKAAITLDLFSAVGPDSQTAAEVAVAAGLPERSARILCDYLALIGFLEKHDGRYRLTPDSALFLDRRSPAFLGGAIHFLSGADMTAAFDGLDEIVRRGTTLMEEGKGSVAPDNPLWIEFARNMAPMMHMPAQKIADILAFAPDSDAKVLDIAAGHGLFGIELARRSARLEVTAVDWHAVLDVARENAACAGVTDRYHTIEGDAFTVDFGTGYEAVLLTNFLHHFDVATCEKLLAKVAAALKPGGRAATLEFVPNEDRISPPGSAGFPLTMLVTTPGGDAYTFAEYERMFANTGFTSTRAYDLSPGAQQLLVSTKG
jgi:ubiquinone/menaquinone biosynthesis C-methylase UbiE